MAEHTQKKPLFSWPWSKPKPPSTQIWIQFDETGCPIPTVLGEHTVVVFKEFETGFKAQVHMQSRDESDRTRCLIEAPELFYSNEAFRLWFHSIRKDIEQPTKSEQWLFVFEGSEYWDYDYE